MTLADVVRPFRIFRTPALVLGAALLPAGAFCALLSASHATETRYAPLPPTVAKASPFVVAPADGVAPGACQITALVVDGDEARAGASLRLSRVTAEGSAEIWQALSDRHGAHRFLDLPEGTYQLTALVDDRAPAASPPWSCSGTAARAFFTLPLVSSEHVLSGQVVSAGGGVAPGAELAIAQDLDSKNALVGTARIPVGIDGTFSFRLAPGRYLLLAQAPNHAQMIRKMTVDASAPRQTTRFSLTPAPHVIGRVVDETGDPVPDALVALAGSFDPKARVPTVRSDADGAFSLPVSEGQDVVITARGGGLVARTSLGVAHGTVSGIELVARSGQSVEGIVTKPNGDPWAFGEVHYRVRDQGLSGVEKADGNGHFVLDGMPNDADVEVWAEGNAIGAWGAQVASPGNDKLALVYIPPAY